ncbi:arrestin [Polyplosphaeria fusca]|uniref:Arrestin n=1 Tax=Polyplosphaeria fusca TaxID=682080 RepID=A0A9P4QQ04_9PLEO|nr:arrestin [Polyplosphaeria fusca]
MPARYPRSSGASLHSMQTIGNQIGYKVRNIAHYGQPDIDISLEGEHGTHGTYVTSFSTMDTIRGTVTITAKHDTRFEDIDISFIGTAHTFVDRLTTTPSSCSRSEASHRFLTLKQPIPDSDFPAPRVLAAGTPCTFSFLFAIPEHLLPRACLHKVNSDHVRNMHLMLPPSLGDPSLAGFGSTLLDDLAPEMSKIIYGIKVRIMSIRETDGSVSLVADKLRKVRVKPAFEEQPPLNVDPSDPEYRMRQEKVIRKGLFKGKLGTLTAQGQQSKPLVIPGARTVGTPTITTMAKLVLRFDPADADATPPKLTSLATKIRVSTYYASAPRHSFPVRSTLGYDLTQGVYTENINLSTMCVASAPWIKHAASDNPPTDSPLRRDSGISDCSTLGPDEAFSSGVLQPSKSYKPGSSFYTTEVVVPVALPLNKNFLPTFHSCLVSRVYALILHLGVAGPGVGEPSLHLKVPMQIAAEGSVDGIENARARSVEMSVAREADSMFVPRSVVPPGAEDLPPQYVDFVSGRGVEVVG